MLPYLSWYPVNWDFRKYVLRYFTFQLYSYLIVNQLKGVTMDELKRQLAEGKITQKQYNILVAQLVKEQTERDEAARLDTWKEEVRKSPLAIKKKMAKEASATASIFAAIEEDSMDRRALNTLAYRLSFAGRGGSTSSVF